ncbi:MAG: hypothetical protein WDA05_03885 [Candidatus Methanomethylophilaceae archaeon]|nr:hypothetical protein [Candidatus Methanomethylophilaceae archaeon]MDD2778615.1 hypothetical protein [Candidatus Methanomethylophilaceae archaeon]MDD3128045.1 hypothetical protein [Candidatus Methanomethylophilaceae archaeon]MDD4119493.1 hypothetical protein [Candidatus Methanomethylophilaceae archaeon]MDD4455190.1 hypothetical protein [Candidatus Methanomethylophilaceae archaeon]
MESGKKAKVIAAALIGGVLGVAMGIFLYFSADMPAAFVLVPLGMLLGGAQAYMMPEKD